MFAQSIRFKERCESSGQYKQQHAQGVAQGFFTVLVMRKSSNELLFSAGIAVTEVCDGSDHLTLPSKVTQSNTNY